MHSFLHSPTQLLHAFLNLINYCIIGKTHTHITFFYLFLFSTMAYKFLALLTSPQSHLSKSLTPCLGNMYGSCSSPPAHFIHCSLHSMILRYSYIMRGPKGRPRLDRSIKRNTRKYDCSGKYCKVLLFFTNPKENGWHTKLKAY